MSLEEKFCSTRFAPADRNYHISINYLLFQLLHCFETLNVPVPFRDWDDKDDRTFDWYESKFYRVRTEMIVSYVLSFIISLAMLIPLWYTGT